MANVTNPRGLEPRRHLNGSPYNGQNTEMLIPSSDATAVYVGDIVKIAGASGAAGTVVNGRDCEGMPTVALATAGTTGQDIAGVVVGFLTDVTDLSKKHRVASTNRIALVCTDPTVVYEIQEDAVGSVLSATSVGLNAPYTTTAGSATTGLSAMALDSSAAATTSTLPLKIIGLAKTTGNAWNTAGAGSDPARVEVILNTGAYLPNTAGV